MKNWLKQLLAWGTESAHKVFLRARLELAGIYAFALIAVLFLVHTSLYATGILHPPASFPIGCLAQTTTASFCWSSIALTHIPPVIHALVLTTIGLVSFVLASITMHPLEETYDAQRRFIADASHELRTPLAVMRAMNELAIMDGDRITTKTAQQTLRSNIVEIDRMSNIIKNLLNLSRNDAVDRNLTFSRINLAEIVRHIADRLADLSQKRGVTVRIPRLHAAYVWGNATALEELIMNILKNAITYTPSEGEVHVTIHPNARGIQLQIEDTGIGIPPRELPYVFNPFYRAKNSGHKRGSGLGLTIAKEIMKQHKGTIAIKSQQQKGTTVTTLFPPPPLPATQLHISQHLHTS